MKKLASILSLPLLVACGMNPDADSIEQLGAIEDSAQPAVQLRMQAEPETQPTDALTQTAPTLLTGIDCDAVIPYTGGEYILSEISHLEAIERSGCTYFAGNVRVAFKVPLVPSAQWPLFRPQKITEIAGRIIQVGTDGIPTTQLVQFAGLEKAGRIESRDGQPCPYPALRSVGSIFVEDGANGCSFPALTEADEIKLTYTTKVPGFNALTKVNRLFISGGTVEITGFKGLVNAGALQFAKAGFADDKWSGSFPAMVTAIELLMEQIDLKSFSLPKLSTVTGRVDIKSCSRTFGPFKVLKEIGGTLTIEERIPYLDYEHFGPATLTTIGGGLNIKLTYPNVRGYAGLKTLGGVLTLSGWPQQVSGFDSLTSAGGISLDGKAMSITGFGKLATVNGNLHIKTEDIGTSGGTFDAFTALTEVKGTMDLTIANSIRSLFPRLRTVGVHLNYTEPSNDSTSTAGFGQLQSVGGSLITSHGNVGFDAVLSVGGTLSILNVPGALGYYTIPGYKKVRTVGGDLILDKRATRTGAAGTQRLLDQLVGFTGNVIFK